MREHEWNPLAAQPGRAAARADGPPVRAGRGAAGGARRPAGRRSRTRSPRPVPCCATAPASTWRPRSASSPARRRWSATSCRRCWPQAPALAGTVRAGRRGGDGGAGGVRRLAARHAAEPGDGPRSAAGPPAVGGQALAHAGHRAGRRRGAARGPRRTWSGSPRELREVAAELVGGPADDETVRRALDQLAAEHPDNASIVRAGQARRSTETTEFVREHDLVSLVDDPLRDPGDAGVRPRCGGGLLRPARARWRPRTCRRSTASRRRRRTGRAERVESFYREYNDHMVRNLTVHEAMPGHFLQLAHARRLPGRAPGCGRWASPARSWRAGRSTPRS